MRVRSLGAGAWVVVLVASLGLACGSPPEPTTEAPVPSTEAPVSSTETPVSSTEAVAQDYNRRFYAGDLAELYELFTPEMAQEMTFTQFSRMHRFVVDQLGQETELLGETVEARPPYQRYLRRARFERYAGEIEISWLLRDDHSIAGVVFRPAETPGQE